MSTYLVIAALSVAGAFRAGVVEDSDRAYLVAHLEMTLQIIVDATQNLTREQWLYSPESNRWSIAQCVDHLANTEGFVLEMVRDRLIKSDKPIEPFPSLSSNVPRGTVPPARLPRVADALLIRASPDRTQAVRLPGESRPPIEPPASRRDQRSIDGSRCVSEGALGADCVCTINAG
jgi:hypothetical protein